MKPLQPRCDSALTRLEVLAVLASLALVAAVALPALAGRKPRSDAAVCASNLRQLGMAALIYSMEEDGLFHRVARERIAGRRSSSNTSAM